MGPPLLVEALGLKLIRLPLLLAVGAAACSQADGDAPRDSTKAGDEVATAATSASLVTADTVTVELPLSLPAQLYVEHDAAIYARSSGVVESVLTDLGGRVRAGQLMARLENTDQTIALEQAKDRHDNAVVQADRQRALKSAGVVTQADSERVELELREAVLSLRKAQRDFDLTRIVAPFDGAITGRTARVGRLVESGDSLFHVTALAPVLASVRVPEASAFGVKLGAEAEAVGPRGEHARARVVRASPVIDAASGTREVVVQLVSGDRMPPGSSITLKIGSERRRVVAVPREAVDEGYALVWEEERSSLRQVTVGGDLPGGRVEVVSGVAPGEKLVRRGP
jgi:RND family efflux transporter MFP subunit